jgi:pyruvoyl-dependent arginine decarboxylase (PvlArgDC)
MALKYEIETIDGLDESVAALYEKDGNKYRLSVDGLPEDQDVAGLKAKNRELIAERLEAQKREKAAEEAAQLAAEETARKGGDIAALEKSWQDKLARREAEWLAEKQRMGSSVTAMTVDAVASRLAAEMAVEGSAPVLLPHIRARLAAEERDGQYITVVRDSDGKPSALSIDELKAELSNNPAFARVIAGSKASGGVPGGRPGVGGSGSAVEEMMKLPPVERMNAARNAQK